MARGRSRSSVDDLIDKRVSSKEESVAKELERRANGDGVEDLSRLGGWSRRCRT